MSYKILLVDDDRENLNANSALLAAHGYAVTCVESGGEAIKVIKNAKRDFALVLMDYHMPGMSGAEAVIAIKSFKPSQQILAFSLDDTRETMRETFKAGVLDFLDKNSDNDVMLAKVKECCADFEENLRQIEAAEPSSDAKATLLKDLGMIGQSKALFELASQILKVAPTQATTLILGESGTGKELVAKALHHKSDRSKAPFVAINIAAEPINLIDSSLFGHRKGSFTGAMQDQAGKFQLAHRGTLFLDEIGDMSLDTQVKLLRVLQEREIHPVGSLRPVPVDVRIVAATHKDLKKMVSEGTFREDLYYRISSVVLSTTPLRERVVDIEPLVAHFVQEVCRENKIARSFTRNCLEVFSKYSWRGNVRELRSVVESHLVRGEGPVINADQLDSKLSIIDTGARLVTMDEIDSHLDGVKRNLVEKTINESSSRAEASRRLGIPANRLHYFINKWSL
jgi:DNA-binding NtrC family response regulator